MPGWESGQIWDQPEVVIKHRTSAAPLPPPPCTFPLVREICLCLQMSVFQGLANFQTQTPSD